MRHYSVQRFTADIAADDYIRGFRDEPRFLALCRECPNFGNSWGCPPFDFDTETELRRYRYAHLIAVKIIPEESDIQLDEAQKLILPERMKLEQELLGLEKRIGGRSFAYIGKCLHCPDGACTRRCGLPCRHPEKVRPSLEAFGFDISRTLSELFGIRLLWGKDGVIPEYLTLVCGFFHNCDTASF